MGDRRRLVALLVLAAVPVMVEAVVLRAVGFDSALELAAQASAPPVLGSFHDLRWLLVYHDSWFTFVAEAFAAVWFRALLTAALVRAAWPRQAPAPDWIGLLRSTIVFAAVAVVVLSPWAAVAGAASETSLSWFLFGELIPVVFLALFLQRGGIAFRWWRGLPSARAAGWTVAFVGLASVDALVIGYAPGWWVLPVAAIAGVVNGLVWRGLVRAVVLAGPKAPRVPAAPIAVAVTAGALLAMSQYTLVGSADAAQPMPTIHSAGAHPPDAVLYVAGYDSLLAGHTTGGGLAVRHFSYRGIDTQNRPLPYGPDATHQSLSTSAQLLARQVEVLHHETERPVALIAQSEGTLVVRTYLATLPHADVDAAVLLSPLVQPGRIYYPPPTSSSGWGVVMGWELRGMLDVVRLTTGATISPDEPFVRSVLDHAPLYRNRMLCPVPGVRVIAFLPTVSAAVVPPTGVPPLPLVELPGLHASLLGRPDVQDAILAFLTGQTVDRAPGLYYPVIQKAAAVWQAPALALAVNPAWPPGVPDSSFGQNGCTH